MTGTAFLADLRPAGHRRDLLDVAGAGRHPDGARPRAAALGARRRGRGGGARARHAARHHQARLDRAGRGAGRPAAPAGGRARWSAPRPTAAPRSCARWARAASEDALVRHAPFSSVVEEAAAPHADRGIRIITRIEGAPSRTAPRCSRELARRPEIIQGLRNLVQNAVDFAGSTVWIDLDWTDAELRVGDRRRRPGLSARPDRPHRRPLRAPRAPAAPASGRATRAWGSASSSPRPCSSAAAPASPSATATPARRAGAAARVRPPDRRLVTVTWPRAPVVREAAPARAGAAVPSSPAAIRAGLRLP